MSLPARFRLVGERQGFTQVMRGFDYGRALIGLQCLAAARASLRETWAYLERCLAFGQVLADFQGLTFPLAEFETQVAAARMLCYPALSLKDAGRPHTHQAAMAKAWAPGCCWVI